MTTMAQRNHADHLSSLKYDNVEATAETWASGNTKTITNANVKSNSRIYIMWAAPIAESPGIVCSDGSFTITLLNALTNKTFRYIIL